MVDAMLANDAIDKFVNIGTIGLHDVVGETVGIVSIVVMNTQCRQQARSHQRASHHRTHDRISVIEQVVRRHTLLPPCKIGIPEKVLPVESRCPSF